MLINGRKEFSIFGMTALTLACETFSEQTATKVLTRLSLPENSLMHYKSLIYSCRKLLKWFLSAAEVVHFEPMFK